MECLSASTHPEMTCIMALRMSSNVPLLFEPVKHEGSFYIDGGLANNFAIDLAEDTNTIGINLLTDYSFNNDEEVVKPTIENILKMMWIPIRSMLQYQLKFVPETTSILNLNYTKVHFLQFNMSTMEKIEMFSDGFKSCKKYFNKYPSQIVQYIDADTKEQVNTDNNVNN